MLVSSACCLCTPRRCCVRHCVRTDHSSEICPVNIPCASCWQYEPSAILCKLIKMVSCGSSSSSAPDTFMAATTGDRSSVQSRSDNVEPNKFSSHVWVRCAKRSSQDTQYVSCACKAATNVKQVFDPSETNNDKAQKCGYVVVTALRCRQDA
jgi:hypothetical protein